MMIVVLKLSVVVKWIVVVVADVVGNVHNRNTADEPNGDKHPRGNELR